MPVESSRKTRRACKVEASHEIEPYPLQALHVGHAVSELGRRQGDTDHGVMPTRQSAGLIDEIKSAGEVVSDVVAEALGALQRLTQWSHV